MPHAQRMIKMLGRKEGISMELKFYLWEIAGCIIQGGGQIRTPQSEIGKILRFEASV
jgi:hypothetical protein